MKKPNGLHGFSLLIIAIVVCVYFISMAAVARTAMFKSQNGVIYRGSKDGVALICKVPWNAASVGDIMSVADDAGVSITFFITADWARQNEGLMQSMSLRHGFAMLGSAQNERELKSEIEGFKNAGVDSYLYMPMDDAHADKLLPFAQKENVNIVLSSLDVLGRTTDISDAVDRVNDDWFDGAIIRFEPTKLMAQALPDVISELQEKGIALRLLTELLDDKKV